jgi:hypothetical protein
LTLAWGGSTGENLPGVKPFRIARELPAPPNHSSDGAIVREKAASIAAPQVPVNTSVNETDPRNAQKRIAFGVSDLSALATWRCARRSREPEHHRPRPLAELAAKNFMPREPVIPARSSAALDPLRRDDKTAIELFVADVGVWEARLQQLVGRLADGK